MSLTADYITASFFPFFKVPETRLVSLSKKQQFLYFRTGKGLILILVLSHTNSRNAETANETDFSLELVCVHL